MKTIQLGDRVKDKITGLKGVVICKASWLYGCERITVQPEAYNKDGKPMDSFCIDEAQAELVKERVIETAFQTPSPAARPAGPRQDSTRRPDATR